MEQQARQLPGFSVQTTVFEPVKAVAVMCFSMCGDDGFSRSSVKLWKLDLSLLTIRSLPALRVLTFLPPFFREIMTPWPTTPVSCGGDRLRMKAAPAAAKETAMTVTSTAEACLFMRLLFDDPGRGGA